MNTKSIIFTVGGLVIAAGVGVGIYFIAKKPTIEKLEKDKTDGGAGGSGAGGSGAGSGSGGSGAGNPPSLEEGSFPLKQGSKNKLVQNMQKALNEKYGANLVADGAMGDLTTKAICKHVFSYCISAATGHRNISVDKILYNDILAGKKRTDLNPPTK